MDFKVSLRLHKQILDGGGFVRDISHMAQNYRRTIRRDGGYFQAHFRIFGTMTQLVEYFYTWLGYDFIESIGGITTWNGMIYEMTLNTINASRTRSMDKLWNHVRCKYIDGSDVDQITSAATQTDSIGIFGRKEQILDVGKFDSSAATARRDRYLGENCWAWARPQGSGQTDYPFLDVVCCGYVFTMNFRHTTQADDASDNIADFINDIVTNDCADFIEIGEMVANGTTITRTIQGYERSWDLITRLTDIGDASGNLYRSYIGNDRKFYYEVMSPSWDYYIVKGEISTRIDSPEVLNPWLVKPGIAVDMDYPLNYVQPGSWFYNPRTIIIDEISVGEGLGLTWKSLEFSETDQLALFQEYATHPDPSGESGGPGSPSIPTYVKISRALRKRGWRGKAKDYIKLSPQERRKLKRKYKI